MVYVSTQYLGEMLGCTQLKGGGFSKVVVLNEVGEYKRVLTHEEFANLQKLCEDHAWFFVLGAHGRCIYLCMQRCTTPGVTFSSVPEVEGYAGDALLASGGVLV